MPKQQSPKPLPENRAEAVFVDFKGAYTANQALDEAHRCLYCHDAPCIKVCPTHINIPEFIRKISTGNIKGSARSIFEANILGMSCARVCPVEVLCVGDCVYNELGIPPIQIGKLQRFATDHAFAHDMRFFAAGPDTGKSVALVGGGPASLAAAHELRRMGHACTIYEMRPVLGGLNTTGVAPYKMKADRSLQEVEWILGIGGIDVQTGVQVGKDVSFEELEKRHDAVFLGLGLGPDTAMQLPGEDLQGVYGAVDFIERLKLHELPLDDVKTCVVIGGGNTALDSVRQALGLGIHTTMLYRGTEAGMSGYVHEWRVAQQAGARAEWQSLPTSFEGKGRVRRVHAVRLDANKQPIADTHFSLEADLVLLAIGQSKLTALLADLPGLSLDRGRVVADELGRTGRAGYFAGGDCHNGGKEVVNAAAEGKRAAQSMHAYLMGAS